MDNGRIELKMESMDLTEVCRETVHLLTPSAEKRRQNLLLLTDTPAGLVGDRAKLVRWCFAQENLDQRDTQALIEALCLTVTDMLCARQANPGLSTRQLTEIAALASRCGEYLRVNTGSKHIFGLLAVDTPLGSGNRG